MKRIKKSLLIMLVIIMTLTSVPLSGFAGLELHFEGLFTKQASAADSLNLVGQCGDNIYWSFDDETGHLTLTGSGKMWDTNAFFGNKSIKSLEIGDGITTIDSNAFNNCTNLATVTGGQSLEYIKSYAFCATAIDNIDFAENVNTIEWNAFENCNNLTELYFSNKIMLDYAAFAYCANLTKVEFAEEAEIYDSFIFCENLETIIWPDKANSVILSFCAFIGCDKIKELHFTKAIRNVGYALLRGDVGVEYACRYTVDDDNENFSSDANGVLYDKGKTKLLYYPASCENSKYVMPDTVETVGTQAGYGATNLKTVQLSSNLKTIEEYAFSHTGLTSLIIPDSVEKIEEGAFTCEKLKSVIIGAGVANLECDFQNASLNSIVVSSANQYYYSDSYGALYDKQKTTLFTYPQNNPRETYTLPDSVTTIEYYALQNCRNLKTIVLNDKITKIYLSGCTSLENVNLPDTITELSLQNCYNVKLSALPKNLTAIGSYAFQNCYNITIDKIPDNVKYIDSGAFANCKSIEKIYIGKNVTQSREYYGSSYKVSYYRVFEGCDALKEITVDKDNSYFLSENGVLYNKDKTCLYHYPAAKADAVFSIPEGVKTIDYSAFYNALNLTQVNLPSTLTSIGRFWTNVECCGHAFGGCVNLEKFTVNNKNEAYSVDANGVLYDAAKTAIMAYPLGNKMTTYTIPATVTSFYAADCYLSEAKYLENILVADGNTAFCSVDGVLYNADCTKLLAYSRNKQDSRYEIADTATSVANCVFNQHPYLKEVMVPESVKSLYLKNISLLERLEILNKDCTVVFYPYQFTSAILTICGYKGSTAEKLAEEKSMAFEEIGGHTHEYAQEITTAPTHLSEGVKTFTCECGDSYTEAVEKLPDHTYISKITKEATHLEDGIRTYICECLDSYSEIISKIADHTYHSVVTDPTCTEKGFTTFTCECGDSYVTDYTDAVGHSYSSQITTPATHIAEGVKTYTCTACGDTYTQVIEKIAEHPYESVLIPPTCENEGQIIYSCICGDSHVGTVAALGHDFSAEFTVDKEATETEAGTQSRHCLRDGCTEKTEITEIPKLKATFRDCDFAKQVGTNIIVLPGVKIGQLLMQTANGSVIKDKEGREVAADAVPGTGMTLILVDATEYEIVVLADVDGNGLVTSADARLALRAAVGLEQYAADSAEFTAANVDKQAAVSSADARLILRAAVGLEDADDWMF